MKTVKVTFTRKIHYEVEIEVNNEDFELIKDLDYDDVEMYDRKTIKTLNSGHKTISPNPQYEIFEDLDVEQNELEREDCFYDVTVEEL